ncbi:MAG: RNA methyltransferase [Treponema sp. CETP13]|nr:MAG: RNA methyltransferase [Treponema sp. CETP13]
MNLSQIVIVLCHPDSSQNIGSICRAMLNMGITQLRIIGDKTDYDSKEIRKLSIHAYQLWLEAKFFPSLQKATNDCVLTAGTTRRKGKNRKPWFLYPEEFSEKINTISQGNIAIIFGNERTGLTDEELDLCTLGVTIPSSPEFSSLNLSHAVQIITYSIFTKATRQSPGYKPVTLERTNKAVQTINNNLEEINFFKLSGQQKMQRYWTSIISRASLSESELSYLEQIFTKIAGKYKKKLHKTKISR